MVNADDVILDNIWAWRADHGTGVGWTVNTADTGVVVNGDDVTTYGLFVEHFQKYQTIWNGERGRTIFYQSELPYDPPSQAAWTARRRHGWASYKVGRPRAPARGLGSRRLLLLQPGRRHPRGAGDRGAGQEGCRSTTW